VGLGFKLFTKKCEKNAENVPSPLFLFFRQSSTRQIKKNGHFLQRGKTIFKISLMRREKKEDKEEDKEEEEKTERGRNALKRKVIRRFFFRF